MTTQTLSSRLPLPVKPWSSGRVLTTAQREAKRRKDRTTKRARVQKQNDSVKSLQSQIANLQAFVQTHIGSIPSDPSGDLLVDNPLDCPNPVSHFHDSVSALDELFEGDGEGRNTMSFDYNPRLASEKSALMNREKDKLNYFACLHSLPPLLHEDQNCSILRFTSEVFDKVRELNIHKICLDDQLNQDAIIRGVLEGWNTLHDRVYSCPLWTLLGQIDERVFIRSGILTRFSMLRMIHLMHQVVLHAESTTNLPTWYRPRPTQLCFPHHVTADYFAWPGFRERLVISNCEILNDRFFKYFASCFRLFWPYPISDAYRIDPASNLYLFSNTFERHVHDIHMWTMNRKFFEVYPDLHDDMASETPVGGISVPMPNDANAVAMASPDIFCTSRGN